MAKQKTFGYHPIEAPRIFEIDRDAGETLPAGWVDTPAKLAPESAKTAAAGPQVRIAAPEAAKTGDAARIDELAAEVAALTDMIKALRRRAPKRRRRKRKINAAKARAAEITRAGQQAKAEI
jgi:hypothetical protein